MTQSQMVSLEHLVQVQPDAAVRFTCRGCGASLVVLASDVIHRLKMLGLGDDQTEVGHAGLCAERPCFRCEAMAWETRPAALPGSWGGASA